MTDEEKYLIERLRELQAAYHRDAEPYIRQLVAIRQREMPVVYMTAEQFDNLQFSFADGKVETAESLHKGGELSRLGKFGCAP